MHLCILRGCMYRVVANLVRDTTNNKQSVILDAQMAGSKELAEEILITEVSAYYSGGKVNKKLAEAVLISGSQRIVIDISPAVSVI